MLWLACNGRLATKDRLIRFGMISNDSCCFCPQTETLQHLVFSCDVTKRIWQHILVWMQFDTPTQRDDELRWVISQRKGKWWKALLVKMTFTEAVYGVWRFQKDILFFGTL